VQPRDVTLSRMLFAWTALHNERKKQRVPPAGVAVAVYFYSRRRGGACGPPDAAVAAQPVERFRHHSHAPNTWLEALFYFAEAIRWRQCVWRRQPVGSCVLLRAAEQPDTCSSAAAMSSGVGTARVQKPPRPFSAVPHEFAMIPRALSRHIYGETLGAWRTADLLIGLAYLARREPPGGETLGDIAAAGRPYGIGLEGEAKETAQVSRSSVTSRLSDTPQVGSLSVFPVPLVCAGALPSCSIIGNTRLWLRNNAPCHMHHADRADDAAALHELWPGSAAAAARRPARHLPEPGKHQQSIGTAHCQTCSRAYGSIAPDTAQTQLLVFQLHRR
jgi:hypothetical protein